MNPFEKQYYEAELFWSGDMLQDAANMERFKITGSLIKPDVRSILDAGCGNGVFVNYLSSKRNDLKIHGMDRSETALKFVKTEKTLGDVSKMPFPDSSFDCVSCLEVIEHLPVNTFQETLKELVRVSSKYLLISVPYNEILEDSFTRCPSCKTIFSYQMHLRSFNDEVFSNLFSQFGIKPVEIFKAGASEQFKFHKTYRKIFYPEQFLIWNSPICPLCGYEGEKQLTEKKPTESPMPIQKKRKLISYISKLPKLIWPKEVKYYWIIGLFEK